jgi:thiamine-monophosphate kinase
MTGMAGGREFDLIRKFLGNARKTRAGIEVGAGDDCAVLDIAPFAISTDMSVENIHFRRAWLSPQEIGFRAAMSALSDLAAVGAQPVAALVSFAFTSGDADGWATDVMSGVTEAVESFDAVLAGGDVARAERGAVIDMVVIGSVDRPILRSTAKPGDEVWVTGSLGGAAAAVAAWLDGREPARAARERFARPVARVREGLLLRGVASAMIDVSDGIAGDARHLAAASGCRLIIDAARLPVHPDASLPHALSGGEDYELCFTAARGAHIGLDVEVTRIGEVVAGEGVEIMNGPDGGGYDHFDGRTR